MTDIPFEHIENILKLDFFTNQDFKDGSRYTFSNAFYNDSKDYARVYIRKDLKVLRYSAGTTYAFGDTVIIVEYLKDEEPNLR